MKNFYSLPQHLPPSERPHGHRPHHGGAEPAAEGHAPHRRGHHHHHHHHGRIRGSAEGHEGRPGRHGHPLEGGRGERGAHGRGGHPGHRGGGRGGRGGDGGSRRPLGRGDLRLLLLALIEQQPRHGYELIQLIGELFDGAYVPSPGVVYPTLSLLEDMELIAADQENGRKRYAITDAGRAQADADREAIDDAQQRTRDSARRIRKAAIPAPVRETMEQLRDAILSRQESWAEEEIVRVTQILADTVARLDPQQDPA